MTPLAVALPPSLHFSVEDGVAVLRLSRPHKRNALDDATVAGIAACFAALPADARAVVVHGEGAHFCAGLDLSAVTETDVTGGLFHSLSWHRAFDLIENGNVPVIAVLHGAVIGGGLELAAACHLRIAEPSAYYALPEGQRGLFVGGGGSVRVPRLVGTARMLDMMLTGRTYGAEDGMAAGFSQYLVEAGTGLARAMTMARHVATLAPLSVFAALHALPRIAEADPRTGLLMESLMAAIASGDGEAKERLRAFLDKRAGKVVRP
ncbi:MAG: crotonase/enoyl-CoA hydratase family protein [Rhodospirillales bacterium]|nr:crotonase/enoyl-CoA hydratase family protein [Rhodospirillales bacterium]